MKCDKDIIKNIEEKQNYILAEINIEENDINKNIRILNSFEEFKRINEFDDLEDEYKYENEKEIKENCIIKINNKIIPFMSNETNNETLNETKLSNETNNETLNETKLLKKNNFRKICCLFVKITR